MQVAFHHSGSVVNRFPTNNRSLTPLAMTLVVILAIVYWSQQALAQCSLDLEFNQTASQLNAGNVFRSAAIAGDRIYAEGQGFENSQPVFRLVTIDISDPENPTVIGTGPNQPTPIGDTGDAVALGSLYIVAPDQTAPNDGNLVVIDMADPNNPVVAGVLDLPGNIRAIEIGGDIVYARSSERLDAISIADPTNPVSLDFIPLTFNEQRLSSIGAPKNNLLPIRDDTFALVDISDPTNLSIIGTAPVVSNEPAIVNNTAVLVDFDTLRIIDITDPANPVELPSYDTTVDIPMTGNGLVGSRAAGCVFYSIFNNDDGNSVAYDFSNPLAPVLIDSTNTWLATSAFNLVLQMDGNRLLPVGINQLTLFDTTVCGSALQPSVDQNPTNEITDEGGAPVVLTATTSFAEELQWLKDGVPVNDGPLYAGATTETLTIQPELAAIGVYELFAASCEGEATSAPVIVAVRPGAGPATGACCLPLGDCVDAAMADCAAFGGSFQGNGTDCATSTCPAVCLGDMNQDGVINGVDTQLFVTALLSGATCP